MPAYNYFPATYQPNYYQQVPMMPQQQPQQPIQTGNMIWVSSDMEADSYPIAPNNAVVLWNRSVPVVYIKQADASGRPSIKIYELKERSKNAQEAIVSSEGKNTQQCASRSEIDGILSEIEAIKNDVKAVKKILRKKVDEDADE